MAGWARKVVTANGLDHEQGGAVSIVAGRVEQLQSLPVDKVLQAPTCCTDTPILPTVSLKCSDPPHCPERNLGRNI